MDQQKVETDQTETNKQVSMLATFKISKLTTGSVEFHFDGNDSDLLGLVEIGKMVISERVRKNAISALLLKEDVSKV